MSSELHVAVDSGSFEEVKRLISKKKNLVNHTDRRGWTPLHCACNKCVESGPKELVAWLNVCTLLLKAGSDPSVATSGSCNTPLIYIVKVIPQTDECRRELLRVLDLMLEKGALINFRNATGISAVHESAFRGALDATAWLLTHGADINTKTEAEETPLHYAVRGRDAEMVKFLLTKKANMDLASRDGTPLQVSVALNATAVRRLLENFRARKEFYFSVPPPAYVQTVPLPPTTMPPASHPLLRSVTILPLPS